MPDNNNNHFLDPEGSIQRIKESNDFLSNCDHSQITVASRAVISEVSNQKIKFDGATERTQSVTEEQIKLRIAACREAYEHAGIIGNAIDLMTDFALEGFDIVHPNPIIQNFYRAWANRVSLEQVCAQVLKCYFRDSNVPILSFRGKIKSREFDKLKKAMGALFTEDEVSSKVIPYAYHILDVLSVTKRGSELLQNSVFEYKISSIDLTPIKNPVSEKDRNAVERLKKVLGDEDFGYLSESGSIRLDPSRLTMLYYKKDDYRAWANPMFWRVISDIQFKKLLRDMDISVCESVINTLTIIALGDTKNGFPATPAMIQKMASLLKTPTKSPTLVWNDLIKIMAEYPPVDKILGEEKYRQVDSDIRAGLGIAEVVLNGQGNNYANSFLSVKTLMERLESGRGVLLAWLENEVRTIAKAMGFKQPAWFKMHHMSLRDEEAEKKLLLELVDRGMLSYETCVDRFGENFQIEVERMKREDDFRRKNEKKYPFVLVKAGKFGPNIANGPLPIFELLDSETIDQAMVRQSPKAMPTGQEAAGPAGGRPSGVKTPQQKKESPRNSPKGQKTSASIEEDSLLKSDIMFEKIFGIISNSLLKARKVDNFSKLENKDQLAVFNIVAKIIERFSHIDEINAESIGRSIKESQSVATSNVMKTYNDLINAYKKEHNIYPQTNDLKQVIVSSFAIILKGR